MIHPVLLPGDLVLTRSSSVLGRFIRWGERSRNEPPSRFNHGLVAVASPSTIVEADLKVRRCSLWDYHETDGVVIYRPLGLTAEQIAAIVAEAERWVGKPYPALELFPYLLDNKLFGGRHVFRRILKPSPLGVCSRMARIAFGKAGLTFGKPEPDPDDMDDFCQAHREKYICVFEQGVLA